MAGTRVSSANTRPPSFGQLPAGGLQRGVDDQLLGGEVGVRGTVQPAGEQQLDEPGALGRLVLAAGSLAERDGERGQDGGGGHGAPQVLTHCRKQYPRR